MSKIGYIRVSTIEQNVERQEVALRNIGIDKFFIEKKSGKNMDREEFKKMMEYLRDGDTLYIESLSRLARSTKDLIEIADILSKKNVELISLKENIDTSSPQGKLIYTIWGALAQFERDCMLQRQREGLEVAKNKGVHLGRPKAKFPENFEKVYFEWKDKKYTAVDAIKKLGLTKSTFYNLVNQYDKNGIDWYKLQETHCVSFFIIKIKGGS